MASNTACRYAANSPFEWLEKDFIICDTWQYGLSVWKFDDASGTMREIRAKKKPQKYGTFHCNKNDIDIHNIRNTD
jgi:hypothetical protein